jgi:hypothetical protein
MNNEEKRLEEISAAVTRYYDSLTEEEVAAERTWGEFASSQFPDDRRLEGLI